MQLIDESNASWKKEREKVREKIKEVKDKIKRLQSLSSKVSADEFSQGGGVDDSKNKKIMESYREWVSYIRNQSYPRMSVSGAVKLASVTSTPPAINAALVVASTMCLLPPR
jgi:hypothetical protein